MPSWKKVLISGSDGALRSLTVTGGITGSLFGTSSWAVSSSVATTSSYALTASYALNGGGGGGPAFPYVGTAQITGSLEVSGTIKATDGITGSLFGTASQATTSSFTVSSSFATTASYANIAGLGGFIQGGNSFGTTATLGTNDNQSLSFETSASSAMFISSSGNIGIGKITPSVKLDVSGSAQITGSLIVSQGITGSLFGTSSWAVSSSYVLSSSFAATASQVTTTVTGTGSADLVYGTMATNDYFRIRIGGTAVDAGFAEIATADNGNEPIYVRQYTGAGAFTTIARTATLLNESGNTEFPGSVSASVFLGPLTGTASFAVTSSFVTASNVFGPFGSNSIISASFAVSSSRAVSSSFAATSSLVTATVTGANSADLVYGTMADNDYFRIRIGGTATDAGFAEIATADGGTEPIYVRQYTGTFSTLTRTATLLDGSGNTQFPGSVSASSFLGPLTGTASFAVTSSLAQSSSFVTASNVFGPFGSNSVLSSSFAVSSSRAVTSSFAISSSYALSSSFATTSSFAITSSFTVSSSFAVSSSRAVTSSFAISASFAPVFPFSGSALITGSLGVTGSVSISGSLSVTQNISGSRAFLSGSNSTLSGSILTVYGSGSSQPVFTVQGSQGELFSITDSLTGSLFSVNDISGLPILEVISDGTTLIGNYQDPMLITTAKSVLTNSGSFTLYSLPTASYDTAFFEYSVRSGSNARAGQIMAIQSGSSVNYTETTTTNFGTTSGLALGVFVSGSNMVLTGSASTTAWTVKSIIKAI